MPNPPNFLKTAIAAFPPSHKSLAADVANILLPFVDDHYRKSSVELVVCGKTVRIPKRIHFLDIGGQKLESQGTYRPIVQCLLTRSTDGYLRQASLRGILELNEPWSIPFVVLLAGEYVVEIIDDIVAALSMLSHDAYVNFVRENRPLMRLLRAKATGYWDCYYRSSYANRTEYPGLTFLHQLEHWAK